MNRFTNYLNNAKLAKLHTIEALTQNARKRPDNAIRHLAEAQLTLLAAMNNFASLAFHKKPKGRPYVRTHKNHPDLARAKNQRAQPGQDASGAGVQGNV